MAKPQKRSNKKGKFSKQQSSESKPDFRDAVLNASRFLKKKSGRDVDEDEDDENLEFDDEELDSDAALGSDDDLDDYMVKKNKKGKNIKKSSSKLNQYGEDEDGWESVDEGELMTLSELWERDDSELKKLSKKSNATDDITKTNKDKDIVFNDDSAESEQSNSEESGSESGSDSDSESDEESEEEDPFDEMKLSDDEEVQLGSVMKTLKSKLPKNEKDKSKKLLINDKTAENEFSLPTQGDSLTFDDMLGDIDDDEDNNGNLNNESLIRDIAKTSKELKEAKNLKLNEDELVNNDENSAFAIPLPVNIQKRHERRAAYEIQKDQVNRWRDIIAHNRDQEVLKFIPEKPDLDKNSAFKTDNDISINDLESKLDSIIDASNLESKETEDLFENIETAKLSKSDMLKRTNELRLMRELMYRGVKDSKRLKKIKSKAYRRQLRKEKMKEQSLISQANQVNGIQDDDFEDNDDPMYQRAKERMTLKHKNTSQWAKQMVKSGMSKDKNNRDELEEMMKQSEKLKMKQLGRNENESSEDERNLSDLEHDVENADEIDDKKLSKVGKGVLAMDFMKNAEERERLIRLKEIEQLRKFENNEDYTDVLDAKNNHGVNITVNNGRRVYTPSALVAAEEARKIESQLLQELDDDDARLLKNRLSLKEREFKKSNERKRKHGDDESQEEYEGGDNNKADDVEDEQEEANPWLAEDDEDDFNSDEDKTSKSSKIKVIDKSSSKFEKSGAKIAKKLSKRKEQLIKQEENLLDDKEEVQISIKQTLQIVDPKQSNKKSAAAQSDDEYESDGNNDDDIRMFKQSDLIQEAFAGDDILVEEFEQEKQEIVEEDGDKQVDVSVPGWGSWAGADQDDGWEVPKNNKKRKIIKTIQGVVSKDKRLDKGKKNVIINERVNKKGSKYQADKVPYPYKTWEEYERSLRTPMGKEWTTTKTHQKLITPSVITKFGSVINPLKAPFSEN